MKASKVNSNTQPRDPETTSLVLPDWAQRLFDDDAELARMTREMEASDDLHTIIEDLSSDFRGPILMYLEAKNRLLGSLSELDHILLVRLRFFERKQTNPIGETYRQRMDRLLAESLVRDINERENKGDEV